MLGSWSDRPRIGNDVGTVACRCGLRSATCCRMRLRAATKQTRFESSEKGSIQSISKKGCHERFYRHIFSWFIYILYLLKLPAPPRADLSGMSLLYNSPIFKECFAVLILCIWRVTRCFLGSFLCKTSPSISFQLLDYPCTGAESQDVL